MSKVVHILRTGRLNYGEGVQIQQYLSKNNPFRNVLILTEHDPVYTIGIRTKNYTAEDEIRLKELGAEFHKTNRGGLITFHGPGQLVSYPILNLKQFIPSIRWYVSQLEQCVIATCREYGIKANTTKDTGIWVGDNKICAIGIQGSRFITTHGLALNCNTDLKWFDEIVPCGIEGKGVTSLSKELQRTVTIENVTPIFLNNFKKIFQCETKELSLIEQSKILKR